VNLPPELPNLQLQTAIDNNIHNSGVTEVLEVTSRIYILE
jgi:hypothetical protein